MAVQFYVPHTSCSHAVAGGVNREVGTDVRVWKKSVSPHCGYMQTCVLHLSCNSRW